MIEFEEIEYKNIRSVGNHPIKIEFTRNPTTVIGGANGSGKSTFIMAFYYGMTGLTLGGITLPELVNSANKKGTFVRIKFKRNGESWVVERGIKPAKFDIYRDGELQLKDAKSADQQKFLNALLGMDGAIMAQTVVLDKTKYVPFMESSLPERRKIVEGVLGIGDLELMNKVLKTKMSTLSSDINRLVMSKNKIKGDINGFSMVIDEIEKSSSLALDETKSELLIVDENIDNVENKIKTIRISQESLVYDSLDSHMRHKRDIESLMTQIDTSININKKRISFFEKTDQCETCKQVITDDIKNTEIGKLNGTVDELTSGVGELISEHDKTVKLIDDLVIIKNKFSDLSSDIRVEESKLASLKRSRIQLNEKIKSLSGDNNSRLEDARNSLATLSDDLESVSDELSNKESDEKEFNVIKELLKDNGIKQIIVNEYINIINKKINEYLVAMKLYVNMTLDSEFKETFHALHKENFSYNCLSTGQRARVNLSIWLAFLEIGAIKNSVSTNVMFLDEILENLDAEGVIDFMSLCNEKLPNKNVFVVTQRFSEFRELFRGSLCFANNEGFTELIKEKA